MWKILTDFNIPKKLINLIKACYEESECAVRIGNNLTSFFKVESGLRQGCILSPVLFNLVLEWVVRRCGPMNDGVKLSNFKVNKFAYADDVDVVGETLQDVQRMSARLVEEGKFAGLVCNEEKTKILLMDREEDLDGQDCVVGQMTIKGVRKFKYLGTDLT